MDPSISSVAFNCPHCGAYAHQTWYRLLADSIGGNDMPFRPGLEFVQSLQVEIGGLKGEAQEEHRRLLEYAQNVRTDEISIDDFIDEYKKLPQLVNLHASQCYACKRLAVWSADRMIYPFLAATAIAPNADMDEGIQRDFKEAVLILDVSPRGGAALLRLCIQKLCKQLGELGKNINEDIASLVKKGLDVRVQRALDIVRVIGNDAVHPGEIDLHDDRETALELARLVNLIADVMISQPKHIQAMYDKLPESKRKAIEGRDKRSP